MSFSDEVQDLPSNLESFVEGDIKLGKFKIPKLALVAIVIGIVVLVALRAKGKGSSGSSPSNTLAGSGGSNDSGFFGSATSPLSGLQPLPNDNGLNSNPLGAISQADIPTPSLSLPDLGVPNLSGVSLSDFSGYGNIPVMASLPDYSNPYYENSGVTGLGAGSVDSGYGNFNNVAVNPHQANSAIASKVANVGQAGNKVIAGASKPILQPNKNTGIVSPIAKALGSVAAFTGMMTGSGSKVGSSILGGAKSVIVAPKNTGIVKPVASVSFLQGASNFTSRPVTPSQLVGLPPVAKLAGSAAGFGGSAAPAKPKVNPIFGFK